MYGRIFGRDLDNSQRASPVFEEGTDLLHRNREDSSSGHEGSEIAVIAIIWPAWFLVLESETPS